MHGSPTSYYCLRLVRIDIFLSIVLLHTHMQTLQNIILFVLFFSKDFAEKYLCISLYINLFPHLVEQLTCFPAPCRAADIVNRGTSNIMHEEIALILPATLLEQCQRYVCVKNYCS